MPQITSQQDLYDAFIAELQSQKPSLTDTNEGSNIDVLAGVTSASINELIKLTVDKFRQAFIETASGPEITNGPDEIETLAVDRYGSEFVRPGASKATGNITFSRANDDAGDCEIVAGTIVKTVTSAAGAAVRFETTSTVTLTGLSIAASVRAIVEGPTGNVQANKVTVIETSLTDSSVTVANATPFAGGEDALDDSEYREHIRLLIKRIRGATKESIESAALAVDGVEMATAIETEKSVIEYDIAEEDIKAGAEFFRIPFVELYIADANGEASLTLINDVLAAIKSVRAYGVYIKVLAAEASELDWTASVSLNLSGPNYESLSEDLTPIVDTMKEYINNLDIGGDFVRADAEDYVMGIWGPSGTGDITDLVTTIPSGDVVTGENEKLIPGTVELI